jgi:hypothetical protein
MTLVTDHEGSPHDGRFKSWVKQVTSIDELATGGYAFVGPFVDTGTVDVSTPMVLIAATARGSQKYHTTTYNVLLLNQAGDLAITDIATTDKERGWALRIRAQVADLVEMAQGNNPNLLAVFTDEELLAEIHRRNL